jgi:hypothetical protein
MCATDGARFSILVKSGLSIEASDVFMTRIRCYRADTDAVVIGEQL